MQVKTADKCRISGEPLEELFSLGELYISDFLRPDEHVTEDDKIGITLMLAPESGLVQTKQTTPSDLMYNKYWYRTGTNATMRNEMKEIVDKTLQLVKMDDGDIYVDIGTNDGTLPGYVPKHIKTVGYDPAKNGYKEVAEKQMTHFVNDYFTAAAYPFEKRAKIITSIAMFYDLDDPHKFIRDINEVLDDDGLFVIQMNYLPLMLQFLSLDNISHEHLEYYSLESLKYLLDMHNMSIIDVDVSELNGGVFRVFIVKDECKIQTIGTQPQREVGEFKVKSLLAYESTLGLKKKETYTKFFDDVMNLKEKVVGFIKEAKAAGKTVACYGASSRGNTMIQLFGLNHTLIDYAAERAPTKFGLRTVGTNIPIVSEAEMRASKPDYLLVLPYAFIYEFVQREQKYLNAGGKFIVPCPKFQIIDGDE